MTPSLEGSPTKVKEAPSLAMIFPETLKYLIGVQRGQSYLMGNKTGSTGHQFSISMSRGRSQLKITKRKRSNLTLFTDIHLVTARITS